MTWYKSLFDLGNYTFIRYRGCVISRGKHPETHAEGFVWFGEWFPTFDLATEAIDNAMRLLSNSLNKKT